MSLNQQQLRLIEDGYKNGIVLRDIARAAGISPDTVGYHAALLGLQHPKAPTRAKTDDLSEASARYQNWQRARNGAAATLKALEGDRT